MRVTRYMCAGFMTFFGAPAPAISGSLDQEKKMSFIRVTRYICAGVLVPFAALQAASMAKSGKPRASVVDVKAPRKWSHGS